MVARTGRNTFQIQLSLPLVILMLVLAGLSLSAAFYLGLVAGKSLRQPPESPVVNVPSSLLSEEEKTESLEFFKLNKEPGTREELDRELLKRLTEKKRDTDKNEQVQETLSQEGKSSKSVSKTEQKTTILPIKQVKKPSQPNPVRVEQPFVAPPRKPETNIKKVQPVKTVKKLQHLEYTVQVFSGRKRMNAEKLVKRLKNKGFSGAYIYQHLSKDGKIFYRVRVGRMQKTEISRLSKKIKALDFIDSIEVTRF